MRKEGLVGRKKRLCRHNTLRPTMVYKTSQRELESSEIDEGLKRSSDSLLMFLMMFYDVFGMNDRSIGVNGKKELG